MSKPCTVCVSADRDEIERSVKNRVSTRETARQFGVSASALSRHRSHADLEPAGPTSSHVAEAEELIAAVRLIRGDDFSAQDAAEAGHLRSIALAVDESPSNVGKLRELRVTLDGFRRGVFDTPQSEMNDLAELIARLRGPEDGPAIHQRTYAAAIAAGASKEAAGAAADAATHPRTQA